MRGLTGAAGRLEDLWTRVKLEVLSDEEMQQVLIARYAKGGHFS